MPGVYQGRSGIHNVEVQTRKGNQLDAKSIFDLMDDYASEFGGNLPSPGEIISPVNGKQFTLERRVYTYQRETVLLFD